MNDLINYYKQSFLENRAWLKKIMLWFILGIVIGAITFVFYPELLEQIIDSFEERFGEDPALDFRLAWQIFLQNSFASLIAIFGGIIFGIIPTFVVFINGFLIGFIVITFLFIEQGLLVSVGLLLGGLVLHGILELPAFLLASAVGLRLGTQWLGHEAKGNRLSVLKKDFVKSFVYLPGIILLLAIAALIEVFVSGKIVDKF